VEKKVKRNYGLIIFLLTFVVFIVSCAKPLKNKPPYWYNGYVYGTKAASYFYEGKISSALTFYKKGLFQAYSYDIPEQSALYNFNIGRCFIELNMCDSALVYYLRAYKEYFLLGKEKESRRSAGFVAVCYAMCNLKDSAMSWYKKGAITPKSTSDKTFWLTIRAQLMWLLDHSKEALGYFDEAYDLYKKQKEWHGAAQVCLWRAKIYYYYNEYDDAAKQIEEALSLGDKTPLRFDRWKILCAGAKIHFCRADSARGIWFYQRAVNCLTENKNIIPSKENVLDCKSEIDW
jgi:tetratricopeptide (TPR) repeat protein